MEYTLKDKLSFARTTRTYSGEWEVGNSRVELSVPPPDVDEHLMRAEDCLRVLKDKWNEVWKAIVEASTAAVIESGCYPGYSPDWAGAFKLEGINVNLSFELEMEFWLTVSAAGHLADEDVISITMDSEGNVVFADLTSLL